MAKYIAAGVAAAVVLFLLFAFFGSAITINVNTFVPKTPTLTHEQELVAPYDTVRAEIKKLAGTPNP